MKTVLQCDFCSHTENVNSKGLMIEHEKKCAFNPKNKYCYTCKHKYEAGYPISGPMTGCRIDLDVVDGEDDGNCEGWEAKL